MMNGKKQGMKEIRVTSMADNGPPPSAAGTLYPGWYAAYAVLAAVAALLFFRVFDRIGEWFTKLPWGRDG